MNMNIYGNCVVHRLELITFQKALRVIKKRRRTTFWIARSGLLTGPGNRYARRNDALLFASEAVLFSGGVKLSQPGSWFRVQGLGFRVWGLGLRAWGSGFVDSASGSWGAWITTHDLECRGNALS